MLICCDGMHRSGSAFQYNLVCSLLEKMGSCKRHGRRETEEEWLSSPVQEWIEAKDIYHVVKSSTYIYTEKLQMARDGRTRIFYIHRDIRDVAVAAKSKWGLAGDELFVMLDRAVNSYTTLEKDEAFGKPWLLHQKYEDVFNNTTEAVCEIARFLNLSPSQEIIEEVIKECSIEVMYAHSKSKSLYFNHTMRNSLGNIANFIKRFLPTPLNQSWGLRKIYMGLFPKLEKHTAIAYNHIEPTRGVPEAWRDQLNKKEQELITARYEGYLMRAGYLT